MPMAKRVENQGCVIKFDKIPQTLGNMSIYIALCASCGVAASGCLCALRHTPPFVTFFVMIQEPCPSQSCELLRCNSQTEVGAYGNFSLYS